MPKPGDYILVHLVEPLPLGAQFERSRRAWPLHVTLATWFSCDDIEGLRQRLRELAGKLQTFTVGVGEEALFGANSDVPVNVLANQTEITDVHKFLVEAVRASGGEFEPAVWMDKDYQAHITHHGEHRRRSGDEETVADFHLMRLRPPNICEVFAQYKFGTNDETTA